MKNTTKEEETKNNHEALLDAKELEDRMIEIIGLYDTSQPRVNHENMMFIVDLIKNKLPISHNHTEDPSPILKILTYTRETPVNSWLPILSAQAPPCKKIILTISTYVLLNLIHLASLKPGFKSGDD